MLEAELQWCSLQKEGVISLLAARISLVLFPRGVCVCVCNGPKTSCIAGFKHN